MSPPRQKLSNTPQTKQASMSMATPISATSTSPPLAKVRLIDVLADIFTNLCEINKHHRTSKEFSAFSISHPSLSFITYLERIEQYILLENDESEIAETFIHALIYIDRCMTTEPLKLKVTPTTQHYLIITAVLLATKNGCDKHYNNERAAHAGGLKNAELNQLEILFLKTINFNLFVEAKVYQEYASALQEKYLELVSQHLPQPSTSDASSSVASIQKQLSILSPEKISALTPPIAPAVLPAFTVNNPVRREPPEEEEESKKNSPSPIKHKTAADSTAMPTGKSTQPYKPSLPYGYFGYSASQFEETSLQPTTPPSPRPD